MVGPGQLAAPGQHGDDAPLHGTRQIALALVASFLTTAVVFVPLIYLHGLARAFFGVQAFAIVTALAGATSGDVVVIAGKGHEATQEFADHTIEFDDRRIAREILETLS